MRNTWKKTMVGLLAAGVAGGVALGLSLPDETPGQIPYALNDPAPFEKKNLSQVPKSQHEHLPLLPEQTKPILVPAVKPKTTVIAEPVPSLPGETLPQVGQSIIPTLPPAPKSHNPPLELPGVVEPPKLPTEAQPVLIPTITPIKPLKSASTEPSLPTIKLPGEPVIAPTLKSAEPAVIPALPPLSLPSAAEDKRTPLEVTPPALEPMIPTLPGVESSKTLPTPPVETVTPKLEIDIVLPDSPKLEQSKQKDLPTIPTTKPAAQLPRDEEATEPRRLPNKIEQVQALETTARQDQSVSLEWSGPPVVHVNQVVEYTLKVRNTCSQKLTGVKLLVRVGDHVSVKETTPVASSQEGGYRWELADLEARTTQIVRLKLCQKTHGELACQAWITVTGTSGMKAQVHEPKLTVAIEAPEKVVVGQKIPLVYRIKNSGDINAENVRLNLSSTEPGSLKTLTLLRPGEEKVIRGEATAERGGEFVYRAEVVAAHGVSTKAEAHVSVLVPKIVVSMTGPNTLLLNQRRTYTIKVRNSGDVPVGDIVVQETVPAGFHVSSVDQQGMLSSAGNRLAWKLARLAVGEERTLQFQASGQKAGTFRHQVTVTGEHPKLEAAADCATVVEGVAAMKIEVSDEIDPVERGGETTFVIRVMNTGSKSDNQVVLTCVVPQEFQFVSATGPVKSNKLPNLLPGDETTMLQFEPISELAPNTEATFKVRVKAMKNGDLRFKASVESKSLSSSVNNEESTRVYGE